MSEISQNIKVSVRIRNTNSSDSSTVKFEKENSKFPTIAILDPEGRRAEKSFSYDNVFGPDASQADIYQIVCPIISKCLQGYNSTIFAYGQTGSGKTYSMAGTGNEDRGIIPRVGEQILKHVEVETEKNENLHFQLTASYLEIYQESLRDLLDTENTNLRVRMNPLSLSGKELYVEGLSVWPIRCFKDFVRIFETGTLNRKVASTNMNDVSSRSHAVLTLTIEQTLVPADSSASRRHVIEKKISKIHLVDLAGSERAISTGASGQRLKEGSSINQSLLSLGNVINSLSTNGTHIPYRDSKLTYLLSDSLGGNSITLMIACVDPTPKSYEESVGTLRFAERVKRVKNNAKVNLDPSTIKIMKLEKEIIRLKHLLEKCRCNQQSNTPCSCSKSVSKSWLKRLFCCFSQENIKVVPLVEVQEKSTATLYERQSQGSIPSASFFTRMLKIARISKKRGNQDRTSNLN
jgi:hypothetical protein